MLVKRELIRRFYRRVFIQGIQINLTGCGAMKNFYKSCFVLSATWNNAPSVCVKFSQFFATENNTIQIPQPLFIA